MKGHYENYGGDGYGGLKENGDYTIKTNMDNIQFNKLSLAIKHFNNITGVDKFFWARHELIDGQLWVDNKETGENKA